MEKYLSMFLKATQMHTAVSFVFRKPELGFSMEPSRPRVINLRSATDKQSQSSQAALENPFIRGEYNQIISKT